MAREARAPITFLDEYEGRHSHCGRGSDRGGLGDWPPSVFDDRGDVTPIQMAEKLATSKVDLASEKSGGEPLDGGGFGPAARAALRSRQLDMDGSGSEADHALAAAAMRRHEGHALGKTDGFGNVIEPAVDRELAKLLQDFHATVEAANRILDAYAIADTLANRANDEERPELLPSPVVPRFSRRPYGRTAIVTSVSVVALLGWLGWRLHEDPSMLQAGISSLIFSADELKERPDPTLVAAIPSGAQGNAAMVDRAKETTASVSLPSRVHGLAGQPIPLDIKLLQPGGDTEVSLMVQGVPELGRLSSGQRVGSDSWILSPQEASSVALLVPEDFGPDQVALKVMAVTSDGRIPQAHALVADVESAEVHSPQPEQAALKAEQVAHGEDAPDISEPSLATAEETGSAMASMVAPSQAPASTSDAQAATSDETPMPKTAPPSQEPNLKPSPESGEDASWQRDPAQFIVAHVMEQAGIPGMRPESPQPAAWYERTEMFAASGPVAKVPVPATPGSGTKTADEAVAAASTTSEQPSPKAVQSRESSAANAGKAQAAKKETGRAVAIAYTAKVNSHVNMRAEPNNDAAVITIAPANSRVGVIRCNRWCDVTFHGKRGWIHKRFFGSARAGAAPAKAGASTPPVKAGPDVATAETAAKRTGGLGGFFRSLFGRR